MARVFRSYSLADGTPARVYGYGNSDIALLVARQTLSKASEVLNACGRKDNSEEIAVAPTFYEFETQYIPAIQLGQDDVALIATETTAKRPVLLERTDPRSAARKVTLTLASGGLDRWEENEDRVMSHMNRPRSPFLS